MSVIQFLIGRWVLSGVGLFVRDCRENWLCMDEWGDTTASRIGLMAALLLVYAVAGPLHGQHQSY